MCFHCLSPEDAAGDSLCSPQECGIIHGHFGLKKDNTLSDQILCCILDNFDSLDHTLFCFVVEK